MNYGAAQFPKESRISVIVDGLHLAVKHEIRVDKQWANEKTG